VSLYVQAFIQSVERWSACSINVTVHGTHAYLINLRGKLTRTAYQEIKAALAGLGVTHATFMRKKLGNRLGDVRDIGRRD
jgi:hypothetical protein